MSERIRTIRDQLELLAAELTDESISILRDAVDRGETRRPEADKKVLQARRSVEKAIRSLEMVDSGRSE